MDDELFGEGIDGVHGLRRRERTRLWYRAIPAGELTPAAAPIASEPGRIAATDDEVSQQAIDALLDEWSADLEAMRAQAPAELTTEVRQQRMRRRLGEFAGAAESGVEVVETPVAPERIGITGWRNVPANAPSLMLAASNLLDAKNHGPVLGPGCRYRVLSAEDGIVELEVMAQDGHTASGFCNAVDMNCIDSMIVNLAGGRKGSNRLRFARLGRGISHVTGSLMSFSS